MLAEFAEFWEITDKFDQAAYKPSCHVENLQQQKINTALTSIITKLRLKVVPISKQPAHTQVERSRLQSDNKGGLLDTLK